MKTTHTPTPWQVGNFDEYRILSCEENGPVGIAACNKKSDAAYIVAAVNCHAELLAALQEMLNQSVTNRAYCYDKNPDWIRSNERVNMTSASEAQARAAIAKAVSK